MKLLIELMLLGCSEYSARLRAKSIKHHRYAKWEQHLDRTYNKQSRYGDMFDIFHDAQAMLTKNGRLIFQSIHFHEFDFRPVP